MSVLYHFSEDPNIEVFVPHRAQTSVLASPLVWAIDEWHAPMYYVPRDCPRACFWPTAMTTPDDRDRWFGGVQARMVMVIESGWLDRVRNTSLSRYAMPADSFELHDETAGHWVSPQTVRPLTTEPMGDLLVALAAADLELRITPTLMRLWEGVIRSTLAFSGTRLRSAREFHTLRLP